MYNLATSHFRSPKHQQWNFNTYENVLKTPSIHMEMYSKRMCKVCLHTKNVPKTFFIHIEDTHKMSPKNCEKLH